MILKKSINNVSKFIISRNKLFFVIDKTIYCNDDEIINLEDKFYGEFYVNDGEIVVQSYYGEFEYNGNKFKGYYNYLNEDSFSYLDSTNNKIILIQNSVKTELDLINQFKQFNNLAIIQQDKKIHAYTLPTAQPLWQFDLGRLGEYKPIFGREDERKPYQVSKFLGVWQDQLLVACDGGLILCLSTENGNILRKWDTLPNSAEDSLKDVFRGYLHQSGNVFQLNKAGNKITGLYFCHWVEICLETGNITTKHLKDAFDKHYISSFQTKSGYAEDETHWYSTVFLDQEKLGLNYMPTAICALNKQTNEIDWFYRFDIDTSGDYVSVQVPQVSNGKLYQLTQNNVLYIFEKENQ